MRLHRLIAILLLLESRGRMKAKDLAEALETSVRSIYRDVDVLAESGIPLVSATGPNGGIALMEGYTVNLRRLQGDEVVQLFLTGMGMPAGGSGETSLLLKSALLKLEASLPAPYHEDIRTAQRRFLFDATPWWSGQAAVPYLEILRTAVWRGRKITADYLKVNGEKSLRKLQPYGLIVKQGSGILPPIASGQARSEHSNAKGSRPLPCWTRPMPSLSSSPCSITGNMQSKPSFRPAERGSSIRWSSVPVLSMSRCCRGWRS